MEKFEPIGLNQEFIGFFFIIYYFLSKMNDVIGLTLNEFIDAGESFVRDYDDALTYRNVAQAICNTLLEGRDLPYDNPNHPFRVFAEHGAHNDNIRRLAQAIMSQFQNSVEERSVVTAFFHSGGSQRDVLEELMDDYYEYVDAEMEDEQDLDLVQQ